MADRTLALRVDVDCHFVLGQSPLFINADDSD